MTSVNQFMRLLVSWVRDFVDVTASAEEIAEKLALRGFEVASIERLGGGDAVIDFEVTANRPDCLSVIGFAREIATVYDLPFRPPSANPGARVSLAPVHGESERLKVTLEDAELCPRYAAAVADVTAGGFARLDDRPPAGGRRPADQPDRRHHELRADGARPSDARLRSGDARRAASCGSGAPEPARR